MIVTHSGLRFILLTVSLLWPVVLNAEPRSWKYLGELSEEERQNIDLRTFLSGRRDVLLGVLKISMAIDGLAEEASGIERAAVRRRDHANFSLWDDSGFGN